ncbi:hypothetical protein QFC21_001173 [Naganishia friedmannii]|uniref:Uncharacterized protein n=1 Tax=Naganishia friedmannii TaxID=89922 RepID=A0ACC2W8E5_9TREE|nr:hypothetical protein QFC21_001173 [Naganishia friedmannii]
MPTTTDTLKPFEPLLGLGAKWQDATSLVRVRETKHRLQHAEVEETESIHQTVREEFPTIVEQYRNALRVQQRLGTTAEGIKALQSGMQEIESFMAPLLQLLETRSSLATQTLTASRHLVTLQALRTRLQRLEHAEFQLLAGKAEINGVLALLYPKRDDKEQEADVGVLDNTHIRAVLEARKGMIKQAATAQLQEAFERAFFIDTSPPESSRTIKGTNSATGNEEDGWDLDEDSLMVDDEEKGERLRCRMELTDGIPLRLVTLNQPPKSKQTHQLHRNNVPTTTIINSLHSLELLRPLLSALQTRIIKHFIRPLIDSYAPSLGKEKQAHRLQVRYTPLYGTGTHEGKGLIELYEAVETRQDQEQGLWRSLTLLFQALRDSLPLAPPSSSLSPSPTETGGNTNNVLASFHRHLVAETLHIVLDGFLLRSLPLPLSSSGLPELEKDGGDTETSLQALHGWVELLRRAQEFEETLIGSTSTAQNILSSTHHNVSVIRDFVESRAGAVFAAGRKRCVLGSVRDLVLPSSDSTGSRNGNAGGGGWGGWQSQLVERERVVLPPPTSVPGKEASGSKTRSEQGPSAQLTEKDAIMPHRRDGESAGGWGFDNVIDLTKDEPEEPVAGDEREKGGDEEDGWGFDEEGSIVRQTGTDPAQTNPRPLSASTVVPASAPSSPEVQIIAPKPIRQARKIGKKGKSAVGAVPSSDGGSTTGTPLLAASPTDDAGGTGRFGGSPVIGMGANASRTDAARGPAPLPASAERVADKGDDSWNMDWEAESHPPVATPQSAQVQQGPTIVRERLRVSVVLDTVVGIVKDELTFIATLQNNGQVVPHEMDKVYSTNQVNLSVVRLSLPSFHSLPASLASIPAETLELVRALVPVLYEAQIRDVPALAVQFANDCSWLAERVRQVLEEMASRGLLMGAEGLSRQADKLVSLSTIVFDKQLDAQHDGIMDTLMDLDGLEATSDDRKFQACTKAFQDVEHKLETLFRIYRDVMPESTCLESMGRLIDAAISQICTDILSVVDITAEESERLKQLCQILRPIEERFNEMKEASLVDITYLLESGALVDFTSDELVHLLLALFTDTPNRADLINKVMSRTQTGQDII